jgi:hypothetical protein
VGLCLAGFFGTIAYNLVIYWDRMGTANGLAIVGMLSLVFGSMWLIARL